MGSLWSFLATHIDLILLILKDTGYVAAGISVIYGVFKWIASAFHTVRNTNANLELLMTNHLPHIQTAVDAQGESLRELKSNVRDLDTKMAGMDTRITDTKTAVHTIGESFLRHLENVSKESTSVAAPPAITAPTVVPRRRRRAI